MVMSFCGFPMIDCYQDHGLLSAAHVLITQSMYAEVDLGLLQAVNYYHKALHLGCCSSPRSASGMVVIPCFELPFRSSIVNEAVAGCCRCSFVVLGEVLPHKLDEQLTIICFHIFPIYCGLNHMTFLFLLRQTL